MPTRRPPAPWALLAACLGLLLPAVPARAAEPAQPGTFQPLTVEDASPIERGQAEAALAFRWDHVEEGDDLFEARPRLKLGALPGLELELAAPYRFGDEGEGDLRASAQYALTRGGGALPALGVEMGVTRTYGSRRDTEAELKALATQPLTRQGGSGPSLHLNLSWLRLFDAGPAERGDRYAAVVGYSQPVGQDTALVLDLAREQERGEGRETNIAEAGLRRRLPGDLVLSAGAGLGLDADSPDFRMVVGLQHSFSLF